MLKLFGPFLLCIASVVAFPEVNDCVNLISDPVDVNFNTRRLVCYLNPRCGRYSPRYFIPNRVEIYEDGPRDGTLLASCSVGHDTVVGIRVRIGKNDTRDNCVWNKNLSFGIIVRIGVKHDEIYRCVISGREDNVYRHFENTYRASYTPTQMKNDVLNKPNNTFFTISDILYPMKRSTFTIKGSLSTTENTFYTTRYQGYTSGRAVSSTRGPETLTQKHLYTSRGPVYQTEHSAYTSVYPRYTTEKLINTKRGIVVITIKPVSTTSVPKYTPEKTVYTRGLEYSTAKPVSTSRGTVYSSVKPVYATREPVFLTEKPFYTPRVPLNTTAKPVPTSRGPVYISEKPVITTRNPVYATEKTINTTRGPIFLTEKQSYTPRGPVYLTEKTVYTTKSPVYSTEKTVYTTKSPVNSNDKPIYTAKGPMNSTEKNIVTTKGLVYSTGKPIFTTRGPVYSTEKPIETIRAPMYSTEKPIKTTKGLVYSTETLIDTTKVLVYSTEKIDDTINFPVYSTEKTTYATKGLAYSTEDPILTRDMIYTTQSKESLNCVSLTTNVQDRKHFTVECTVNNCKDLSEAKLVSLQITKTIGGKDTPIARIEKTRGKAVALPIKDAQKNVTVSGNLTDGQGGNLMSEWDWQDVYDSGTYGCSLNYRYAQGSLLTMSELKNQEASDEYNKFIEDLLFDLEPNGLENSTETFTSEKPYLNPVGRDIKSLETYRKNVIDYFFYEPITFGNKIYHLSKEMFRNDVNSDDLCRVIVEGYLAELDDVQEYDAVAKYLREQKAVGAMIGGFLDDNVGVWKFRRSGREVPFVLWGDGEPSNTDGKEHCIAIVTSINDFMDDTQCSVNGKNYQFVCKTDMI